MPRLQCKQKQQKSTDTLRSLQNANPQNHSAWSRKVGSKKWVINEALAEEVRRGEQRRKRSDRARVAVPETESAAPEPRVNPMEPEVNPKRRLLIKSASSTASGSGQQGQKRSIPDDESGMQVEDTPETGTGVKAQRRLQHHQQISDGEFL